MEDGYALVVPAPGKEKEVIRLLLDLADSPRHVRTNTDGSGITLVVPDYLVKKYNQSGETEVTGVKRRGRPPGRKATSPAKAQDEGTETDGEE